MTLSKISTRQKFKNSYKEASNKKSSINKLQLQLKNIKNDIFEIFKKYKMSSKEASNQKIRKQTIVRIEKY